MKRNTMFKVLSALKSSSGVDGDGYFLLHHVVFISGVPRMTTYRYLKLAVELGFVKVDYAPYRGDYAAWYALANSGYDFIGAIK